MSEPIYTRNEEELCDLEEALASWGAELEQTDHPDVQEALRAQMQAARVAIARLEALQAVD